MKVLVASNDAIILQLFREMSEQREHELTIAATDDDILTCLDGPTPDLIVLDLDSRARDGVHMLKELSQLNCGSTVVLIGSCNPRTLGAARQLGSKRGLIMAPPLAKPLDKARIVCSVLDILSPNPLEIRPRDIEAALAGDQLRLHYQPLVNLSDSSVYGAEALLRWEHPDLGWLQPAHIIPLAEEQGLIVPVTRWVIKEALRQYSLWAAEGWDFKMAINISAQVLRNPDFTDEVVAATEDSRVSPRNVILEITESQTLAQAEEIDVLDTLTNLSLMEFGLAIDDFGTGYSSLGRLVSAPFTEIKIDKSFVMDAANTDADVRRDADVIVHTVTDLGHNLGMTVIAEGVSSREAWDLVESHKADVAQGFFIARPLAPDAFSQWLQRWGAPTNSAPQPASIASSEALPTEADATSQNTENAPKTEGPFAPSDGAVSLSPLDNTPVDSESSHEAHGTDTECSDESCEVPSHAHMQDSPTASFSLNQSVTRRPLPDSVSHSLPMPNGQKGGGNASPSP